MSLVLEASMNFIKSRTTIHLFLAAAIEGPLHLMLSPPTPAVQELAYFAVILIAYHVSIDWALKLGRELLTKYGH